MQKDLKIFYDYRRGQKQKIGIKIFKHFGYYNIIVSMKIDLSVAQKVINFNGVDIRRDLALDCTLRPKSVIICDKHPSNRGQMGKHQ